MPRNEFLNHPPEDDGQEFDLVIVRDDDGVPIDIQKVPKNHPGKGEHEDLSQEVPPIEEDPHMWPDAIRPTLADLRRVPGATTTEAHIAELYEDRDSPLS